MKQSSTDKLIDMVNRVGDYFAAMPSHTEAVAGITHHLRKSWAPSLRRTLLACLGTPAEARMRPLVREALQNL